MKKILRREKTWNLLGMILGIVVILVGVSFISDPLTARHYTTGTLHTYESVEFGADYYTYSYAELQNIQHEICATAVYVAQIGNGIAKYAGGLFVVLGVLIFLHYTKLFFCESVKIAEVPAQNTIELKESEIISQGDKGE